MFHQDKKYNGLQIASLSCALSTLLGINAGLLSIVKALPVDMPLAALWLFFALIFISYWRMFKAFVWNRRVLKHSFICLTLLPPVINWPIYHFSVPFFSTMFCLGVGVLTFILCYINFKPSHLDDEGWSDPWTSHAATEPTSPLGNKIAVFLLLVLAVGITFSLLSILSSPL